jgi:putative acetyltransferase
VKIRRYRSDDLCPLAELFTEAVHNLTATHYDAAQRLAWAPRPPDFDYWRNRFSTIHTLVADDDGSATGFIGYADHGHIDLLFVSPAYARRGVAGALYREAEAALRLSGVRDVFTEASLAARPFFERQGFAVVREETVGRRGARLRRYAMRKRLTDAAPPC